MMRLKNQYKFENKAQEIEESYNKSYRMRKINQNQFSYTSNIK